MKPIRWACSRHWLAAFLALLALSAVAHAQVVRPRQADLVLDAHTAPPLPEAGWRRVDLPHATRHATAWYRVDFEALASAGHPWAVYLPYLYRGGRIFLNGMPLAAIQETSADLVIRWERPHLVTIPATALRPGANQLLIRVPATAVPPDHMPLLQVGPYLELLPVYENRLFWVRTMPQFTVLSCLIVGLLAVFIWWRRREETLYGLFGAASVLWGIRTLTFVIEVLPAPAWHAWRAVYHGATGGFVILMLLFAMALAGLAPGRLRWWLLGYWLVGPVAYFVTGGNESLVTRWWAGGLLPIGAAVLVISIWGAWRRRTAAMAVLAAALGLAVLAGLHDYLIATSSPLIRALAPQHVASRIFLLHYAADIVLVVMGGLLSARFVGTLQALAQLNRTLELRVAERESALAQNYERLRRLERRHAAGEERQQIMRDLHDGVGSQLFLMLSRAEGGQISQGEMAQALRECIADMRLTLEAMSPESNDFLQAWGNFRFRWQRLLEASGLACQWELDSTSPEGDGIDLSPHATLQLLRIVQEALTNVLKHAGAREVAVRLRMDERALTIEVADDGQGLAGAGARGGHGLNNMRARALHLGARLEIADRHPGVRVAVRFDRRATAARAEPQRPAAAIA
jgi:signal transduction histidine kinase